MNEPVRKKDIDWDFWFMLVVSGLLISFMAGHVHAREIQKKQPAERCVVRLDNRSVARTLIGIDGTVLDFPVKPTDVILGRQGSFGIKYVSSDLAISPLSPSAHSHLFVYLEGRRFTFDLVTVGGGGCAVISVRDAYDNQVSVDGSSRKRK